MQRSKEGPMVGAHEPAVLNLPCAEQPAGSRCHGPLLICQDRNSGQLFNLGKCGGELQMFALWFTW